jgi:hypothetical protein
MRAVETMPATLLGMYKELSYALVRRVQLRNDRATL